MARQAPTIAVEQDTPVLCCRMVAAEHPANLSASASEGLVIRGFALRPQWDVFRSVLRLLRWDCPPAKPVVVRTSWLPADTLGECVRRQHRFVIRLNRAMNENQAVETLLHEWAHALAWNYSLDRMARDPDVDRELFEAASHDEAWGCAFSRVWRAYSAAMR